MDEATFSERVQPEQAEHVRAMLAVRVRLRITEQRQLFRGVTFTVCGPAQGVQDAQREVQAWLTLDRMDRNGW